MDLSVIFLIGLTTGGISCMALQGGLLASAIVQPKSKTSETHEKNLSWQKNWKPLFLFLSAKLLSHTVLGFFLGLLGSALTMSLGARLFIQSLVAVFMFVTAMNLLNMHPAFRFFTFQAPKSWQKLVRSTSKQRSAWTPVLLGLLTVFIPCGVTQAVEFIAINSGNPWQGAMIMAAFVLGTIPLFSVLGIAATTLGEKWNRTLNKTAAIILILLALYSANGVLTVLNAPITLQKTIDSITYFFSERRIEDKVLNITPTIEGQQSVTIRALNQGYSPRYVRVRAGVPVALTVESQDTYSCALAFVMRDFDISTFLEATDSKTFHFTPPKPGKYAFSCSMGMYTGVIEAL